jgi:LssY C-terminus
VRSLGWSGTRDIGFSLTRFSFQVTYATDADTNAERDCIVPELRRSRVISDVTSYESGQHLPIERVNHYVTDGAVSVARGKLPEKICLHSRATAHATLSS